MAGTAASHWTGPHVLSLCTHQMHQAGLEGTEWSPWPLPWGPPLSLPDPEPRRSWLGWRSRLPPWASASMLPGCFLSRPRAERDHSPHPGLLTSLRLGPLICKMGAGRPLQAVLEEMNPPAQRAENSTEWRGRRVLSSRLSCLCHPQSATHGGVRTPLTWSCWSHVPEACGINQILLIS